MHRDDRSPLRVVDAGTVAALWTARAEESELERLAETFGVLAHPTRLRIVEALTSAEELCVGDLAAVVGATESAVSHQLRQLRQLRMVRVRREGRLSYYRLDDEHVAELFRSGLDHVRE